MTRQGCWSLLSLLCPRAGDGSGMFDIGGLKSDKNLVHQNAILSPRLMIRCFKINNTTRREGTNPEMMRIRSTQSDSSSAVMRCLEVDKTLLRASCWSDVERRVAVEESSIWVVRTERSSSACIRLDFTYDLEIPESTEHTRCWRFREGKRVLEQGYCAAIKISLIPETTSRKKTTRLDATWI